MSRHSVKIDRFTIAYGADFTTGSFLQIFDPELEYDDPSGEGLILDIDQKFGINNNYTGIPPTRGTFEEGLNVLKEWCKENKIKLINVENN